MITRLSRIRRKDYFDPVEDSINYQELVSCLEEILMERINMAVDLCKGSIQLLSDKEFLALIRQGIDYQILGLGRQMVAAANYKGCLFYSPIDKTARSPEHALVEERLKPLWKTLKEAEGDETND